MIELERQWHYWPAGAAFDAWNVARLIELAGPLPVSVVPVARLAEVDTNYWFHAGHEPTVRTVAMHAAQALAVQDFPILLGPDGRVMDGMHRVLRAILEGRGEIAARRFPVLPEPDLVGVPLGWTPP